MSLDLLEEIAENWKLEARDEDNGRYFCFFKEVNKVLEGKRSYIIGRKGTGKTAISEYIAQLENSQREIFTEKLKFKNFPFNELYELKDGSFTPPNQYITLWKYLIYSVVCKMMLRNQKISREIQESLNYSYVPDKITLLPRQINEWTSDSFDVLPVANSSSSRATRKSEGFPWITKVDILEEIIMNHLDNSKYYIVFDELDEDFNSINDKESFGAYTNLLTSLFKAVQEVRSIFGREKKCLYPVIFLRDDIYGLIKDSDKNKWSDFRIELDWNTDKIKRLIAFRISKALDKDESNTLNFDEAWRLVFDNAPVFVGNQQRKPVHIFEFISRGTHLRPRDFIRYIQVCAEETLSNEEENSSLILPRTVKKVDKEFSNYFKAEIEDEIFPALPDISNIFAVLSEIRKQTLSIEEFKTVYRNYVNNETITERNVNHVLQLLYDFSIIGNRPKVNYCVFKYQNRHAKLNFSENITIHRGLFKSLQIL
jgi:hypothetical protein